MIASSLFDTFMSTPYLLIAMLAYEFGYGNFQTDYRIAIMIFVLATIGLSITYLIITILEVVAIKYISQYIEDPISFAMYGITFIIGSVFVSVIITGFVWIYFYF